MDASQVDTNVDETVDENVNKIEEPQTEGTQEPQVEDTQSSEKEDDAPLLTDKGTKLDPNPLSAVHQELANERRRNQELLNVLAQLTKQQQQPEAEELPFEKLETVDDVVNAFKTVYQQLQDTRSLASQLKEQLESLSTAQTVSQAVSNLEKEVVEVRGTYPELDPKSPQYVPELEAKVSELYERLNFDGEKFLNKVSLKDITDMVMSAAKKAKIAGAKEAQTTVISKKRGKVVSSTGKPLQKEPETVEAILAQRIKNTFK